MILINIIVIILIIHIIMIVIILVIHIIMITTIRTATAFPMEKKSVIFGATLVLLQLAPQSYHAGDDNNDHDDDHLLPNCFYYDASSQLFLLWLW